MDLTDIMLTEEDIEEALALIFGPVQAQETDECVLWSNSTAVEELSQQAKKGSRQDGI